MIARTRQHRRPRLPAQPGILDSFMDLRADYDMSRESRFVRRRSGLAPLGGPADYHIARNETLYYRDIEKARDMVRNDAVVGQTIDRAVANEIQTGFTLKPQTPDEGINRYLWDRWQDWAHDPEQVDIAGEMNFCDMEQEASRAIKRDGDCVIAGTVMGPLQFFEGHTIRQEYRSDNVVLGVEMDLVRRRIAYYVCPDPIDPYQVRGSRGCYGDAIRMPVRDEQGQRQVFHIYHPKRTTLTRGVTAVAPVFQLAGMMDDTNFAKVLQSQIASCIVFLEKTELGAASLPSVAMGQQTTEQVGTETEVIEGIQPGLKIRPAPGRTLEGFSPNTPNPEFFDHYRMILQLIGVNLGMPLCMVLMDASETNFTGWRGAVDEARKGFSENQQTLIKRFHTPCYRFKLNHFVDEDPVLRAARDRYGDEFYRHQWKPQAWPYVEPMNDVQADLLQLRGALNSPSRIQEDRGRDWTTVYKEINRDNGEAITDAIQTAAAINAANPDPNPVTWREVLNMATPEGATLNVQPSPIAASNGGQPDA